MRKLNVYFFEEGIKDYPDLKWMTDDNDLYESFNDIFEGYLFSMGYININNEPIEDFQITIQKVKNFKEANERDNNTRRIKMFKINKICKVWNREFEVVIEKDEDNNYLVGCPRLQGCNTFGDTMDEAMYMIEDAITLYLESIAIRDLEMKIPETDEEKEEFFHKFSDFIWKKIKNRRTGK